MAAALSMESTVQRMKDLLEGHGLTLQQESTDASLFCVVGGRAITKEKIKRILSEIKEKDGWKIRLVGCKKDKRLLRLERSERVAHRQESQFVVLQPSSDPANPTSHHATQLSSSELVKRIADMYFGPS